MGRYIKGAVNEELSLGTLAATTLVSVDFDDTVLERTLISSIVARYSMADMTEGAGIGPILVGIAHSDYSDAEIEGWIENAQNWDEGDKVAQEVGRRLCRKIGIFATSPGAAGGTEIAVLNDGKAIKTKLNWILNAGQTLSVWGYNMGANPLATTIPVIRIEGHANLWPK